MPLLVPAARPEPRFYQIDGRQLPRVSTVLATISNPGIVAWKLRVGLDEAARISKTATDYGTRLHRALEVAWGGGDEPTPPDLQAHVDAAAAWAAAYVASVVSLERRVVSLQHGYAGTLDCLAEMREGGLAVIDFKSSKHHPRYPMDPNFRLQLAAYRLALAEQDGLIARRRLILQFPSNEPGRFLIHELDNHREDTEAWLNLLAVYRWLEAHR